MLKEGFYNGKWVKPYDSLVYVEAGGKTALTPQGERKKITNGGYGSREVIKEVALEPASPEEVETLRTKASQLLAFINAHKPAEKRG